MRYAVIIVNWQGTADTLACVASIAATTSGEAVVVLVDNGSRDDPVPRFVAALAGGGAQPLQGDLASLLEQPEALLEARAVVVASGENLGFAAGANLGLRVAAAAGLGASVFLNNDTIVESGALDAIVGRLLRDQATFACLPMLVVQGTDRIWNCGGVLWLVGLRRYHLANRPRSEGAAMGEIGCSFFTGCCFAVRTAAFADRGGFSERFFFGEEDFELALWMRDRGLAAVCLTSAVVQHKVSASFDRAATGRASAKVYVYYLNRFIHMRLRLGRARWRAWLAAYLPYVAMLLLVRRIVRVVELPRFLGGLVRRAGTMDGVTRADFLALMQGGATA